MPRPTKQCIAPFQTPCESSRPQCRVKTGSSADAAQRRSYFQRDKRQARVWKNAQWCGAQITRAQYVPRCSVHSTSPDNTCNARPHIYNVTTVTTTRPFMRNSAALWQCNGILHRTHASPAVNNRQCTVCNKHCSNHTGVKAKLDHKLRI
jgi:hypothetical protein